MLAMCVHSFSIPLILHEDKHDMILRFRCCTFNLDILYIFRPFLERCSYSCLFVYFRSRITLSSVIDIRLSVDKMFIVGRECITCMYMLEM